VSLSGLLPDAQTTIAGGALAVLLVREVFGFTKVILTKDRRQNGSGGAGEKSVEFWQNEQRQILRQELMASYTAAFTPIADHMASIRASNHRIAETLQKVSSSTDQLVRWVEQQDR